MSDQLAAVAVTMGERLGGDDAKRSAPAESKRLKAEQGSWAAARGSSGSVWGWCTVGPGPGKPRRHIFLIFRYCRM
jgi:hypothetical protein